jgi:hypothetical protein
MNNAEIKKKNRNLLILSFLYILDIKRADEKNHLMDKLNLGRDSHEIGNYFFKAGP